MNRSRRASAVGRRRVRRRRGARREWASSRRQTGRTEPDCATSGAGRRSPPGVEINSAVEAAEPANRLEPGVPKSVAYSAAGRGDGRTGSARAVLERPSARAPARSADRPRGAPASMSRPQAVPALQAVNATSPGLTVSIRKIPLPQHARDLRERALVLLLRGEVAERRPQVDHRVEARVRPRRLAQSPCRKSSCGARSRATSGAHASRPATSKPRSASGAVGRCHRRDQHAPARRQLLGRGTPSRARSVRGRPS